MKTIKFAIYLNVLLYAVNLAFTAYYIYWFFSSSRFSYAPKLYVAFFIILYAVICGLLVSAIIGLLQRKNWGRVLTLSMNLIFSTVIVLTSVFEQIGIYELGLKDALASQKAVMSYIAVLPFVCLALLLLNTRTKAYFQTQ